MKPRKGWMRDLFVTELAEQWFYRVKFDLPIGPEKAEEMLSVRLKKLTPKCH